ncbi:hypothetical protein F9802_04815 [Bacillus aerolatus]|uniref:Flagellar hook-length control protein-like C-terminal domain-containing protein n=1 Tax=Bacillus aerolatus TaxID=2653354 RepID=A0A6I1FTG6_9BACI|nr:hypothetical protein [Bacillus aerolatus]KAB7708035.1 hypothetical protein F9802_04815 [Bacillus aerolatus]
MIIQQAALAQGILGKERSMQLREGEMFPAKVVKILPNGMAELSTGTTTMMAKLEVTLQSGERYWFRAASNVDGLQLKVITSPVSAKGDGAKMAQDLLLHLSLPLTKENKAFVEIMMREKLPLTKELIVKAAEWLAKAPAVEGLQVVKMMAERSLPMTKDVFQSLMTAHSPVPLSQLTEELAGKLQQLQQPPALARELVKLLKEWQTPFEKNIIQKVMTAIMDQLILPEKTSASKTAAFDLLKSWGFIPEKADHTDDALIQIMERWKKEPNKFGTAVQLRTENKTVTLQEAVSQFIRQPASKELLQRLEQALMASTKTMEKSISQPLTAEVKLLIEELKDTKIANQQLAAVFKTAAKASIHQNQPQEAIRQLSALFNKEADELIRAVKNEAAKIDSSSLVSLSKKEILFQQIMLAAENDMHFHMSGKEAHSLIKDTFLQLGIDLEGILGARHPGEAELEKMLKPQLLRLLGENIPVHVKELAEQVLGRMNVQPLLSAETGPLQQLIMQVPVNLFGFHTDLTLQWSGKKTDDGKLDSDFCRVLFYLNLENIKETVIDMQVQNRIIQLQVFNETPGLKKMADSLTPTLKARVEEKGYQLSSIQFKRPDKRAALPIVRAMEAQPYEGVDIRI